VKSKARSAMYKVLKHMNMDKLKGNKPILKTWAPLSIAGFLFLASCSRISPAEPVSRPNVKMTLNAPEGSISLL